MDVIMINKLVEIQNRESVAQAMQRRNMHTAGAWLRNLSLWHRLARACGGFVLTALAIIPLFRRAICRAAAIRRCPTPTERTGQS